MDKFAFSSRVREVTRLNPIILQFQRFELETTRFLRPPLIRLLSYSPPSYRGNASRFSARRPAKRSLSAICRHAAQLTGPESAIDYRGRNSRPPDTGYNNPAAAQ